jgi:hypothetical protein
MPLRPSGPLRVLRVLKPLGREPLRAEALRAES